MERTIVTLVGKDTVGIIAKVCTFFSENNINILDIAQTTVQEYINMMMIVDVSGMDISYEELVQELRNLATEIGVDIRCQREEIFDMMHRI